MSLPSRNANIEYHGHLTVLFKVSSIFHTIISLLRTCLLLPINWLNQQSRYVEIEYARNSFPNCRSFLKSLYNISQLGCLLGKATSDCVPRILSSTTLAQLDTKVRHISSTLLFIWRSYLILLIKQTKRNVTDMGISGTRLEANICLFWFEG